MKIVIVGGGTAGWMTALYVSKYLYKCSVTLIESKDIGILGAGEGSTPHFINFLKDVDISVADLIKHAKATFKNGIKFTNWNNDGSHYYHPFTSPVHIDVESHLTTLKYIAEGKNLDDFSYHALISEQGKIPFTNTHLDLNKYFKPKLDQFTSHGAYGLHFDARALANYFRDVAVNRGVKHITGNVHSISSDEQEYITGVVLDDGTRVDCDFIFDCTGLHRLIIGKHFKTEWDDYTNVIPNNRALPFFIENNTDNIPPYTEAIAMKYGWVWKIPVQGRYGCGYVFDSTKLSDTEAKKEIEETFGVDVTIPRSFSFSAGCYKNVWVKNCIAVGLSAGFIEPLEATNIWVAISTLKHLPRNLPGMFNRNKTYIDTLNGIINSMNKDILDFILLHYITKREDTKYWEEFKTQKRFTESFKKLYDKAQNSVPVDWYMVDLLTENTSFPANSHTSICSGLQFYNTERANEHIDCMLEMVDPTWHKLKAESIKDSIACLASQSLTHIEMLEYLKGDYEN